MRRARSRGHASSGFLALLCVFKSVQFFVQAVRHELADCAEVIAAIANLRSSATPSNINSQNTPMLPPPPPPAAAPPPV
jgi:hypothetical protein